MRTFDLDPGKSEKEDYSDVASNFDPCQAGAVARILLQQARKTRGRPPIVFFGKAKGGYFFTGAPGAGRV